MKLSNNAVNVEANALAPRFNNGYLRFYDGTIPATADTAITSQVKLAEARFGATAFGAAVNGVLTANAIAAGTGTAEATAQGKTCAWYIALESDGTTPICIGTVGLAGSGADCIMGTTTISTGASVPVSSFTHIVAKG